MNLYQPVYVVSDGYRDVVAHSKFVYRSLLRANRDLKRRRGLALEKGEYCIGGFVDAVEVIEGRGDDVG